MEEIVDVYDEITEKKTGQIVTKTEAHKKGIWHSAIHIIIINKNKTKILLQKRCVNKKFYPNIWDFAVGGHISSNEKTIESAKRELKEELNLNIEDYNIKLIKKIKECLVNNGINSNEIVSVYLIQDDIDVNDIFLQKSEVDDIKWFTKTEFDELVKNDNIIPHFEEFEILDEIMK